MGFLPAAGRPARRGFTFVEVVVSLLVISTALLILLATVHRGLLYLGETRDEYQAALFLDTAATTLALDFSPPEGEEEPAPIDSAAWAVEEIEPLPGFPVLQAAPLPDRPALKIWVVPREPDEDDGAPVD